MSRCKKQRLSSIVKVVNNERTPPLNEINILNQSSILATGEMHTLLSNDLELFGNLNSESNLKRKLTSTINDLSASSTEHLSDSSDSKNNSYESKKQLSSIKSNFSRIQSFEDLKMKPIQSFDQLNLSKPLLDALESAKFTKPTESQQKILPLVLKRTNDLFIQTGAYQNEILSFLIGAIERIDTNRNEPQVLILSPTLEVALQTFRLAKELTKYNKKIKITKFIHDDRFIKFIDEHIVIGTLSTLLFSIKRNQSFNIRKVDLVIFHELDLILGTKRFVDYVENLIRLLNSKCELQIFTTCFGNLSYELVQKFSNNLISLRTLDIENVFGNLFQFYCDCRNTNEKYNALINILRDRVVPKVIIYSIGQFSANQLKNSLQNDGFDAVLLTGQLDTKDRMHVIDEFRTNEKTNILILNYPLNIVIENQVSLILIFDLPVLSKNFYQEYFYSINKCSIKDRPGFVVNLLTDKTRPYLADLEKHFNIRMIKLDAFDYS